MSLEDRLRRDFSAVEADVRPDPQLYTAVQQLIRRRRTFRLALTGVAAAAAIALTAVAAPALMNRRIEFTPPVATQPPPEPTIRTTEPQRPGESVRPEIVFTDGLTLQRMSSEGVIERPWVDDYSRDNCTRTECQWGDNVVAVAARDDDTPDLLDAAVAVNDGCGDVDSVIAHAPPFVPPGGEGVVPPPPTVETLSHSADACATAPVFSPDGAHVAWAYRNVGDVAWRMVISDWDGGPGDWYEGPGGRYATLDLDLPPAREVRVEGWVWNNPGDIVTEGIIHLRVVIGGESRWYAQPVEREADGRMDLPRPAEERSGEPGWSVVAYASGGGDVSRHEDVAYLMEVHPGQAGMTEGRITRLVGGVASAEFELPPELFNNMSPPFDLVDLWMRADGDHVLYGNTGQRLGWVVDFSATDPRSQLLDADVVHGDFHEHRPSISLPTEAAALVNGTPVDIFFGRDECLADRPIIRKVHHADPVRGAVTELLKGPTGQERSEGITSPFSAATAGALNDVRVVDGQTRVDFRDFRDAVGDDQCTKDAIVDALNKTLFALPSVESTLYSFDGSTEKFQKWAGPPSPPALSMDTHKRIYSAALGHDWQMLGEISADTSCTRAPQPQLCVSVWKDQESNGEDPLGTMVAVLSGGAAKDPEAPIWVYPREAADPASGYSGPRLGIDENGAWRYFFLEDG
jgi:hypothetical protein